MRLPTLVFAILMSSTLANAALADSTQDMIIAQLDQEGYSVDFISTTLLGRIRIDATKDNIRREIVINPRTGEVLRDYQTLILIADGGTDETMSPTATPTTQTTVGSTPAVSADPPTLEPAVPPSVEGTDADEY